LSDESKEIFELYGIGKGMWGLVQGDLHDQSTRNREVCFTNTVMMYLNNPGSVRDVFESTMNYGAHVKIVEKWLAKEVQSGEL